MIGEAVEEPRLHITPKERRRTVLPAAAGWAILALLVGLLSFQVELDISGDNAEYIVLAKALAHQHVYRRISLPNPPLIETKRPIGFPAFLAGLIMLFGDQLWIMKAGILVLFGLAAGLVWYVFSLEGVSVPRAAAATILFIFNLASLHYASAVLSEMPFLVCGLAVLVLLKHTSNARGGQLWGLVVLSALAIAYTTFVRPNGVALIPTALLYLGMRKRWLPGAAIALGAALLVAPWFWQQKHFTAEGQQTYFRYVVEDTGGLKASWFTRSLHLAKQARTNALAHWLSAGQMILARPRYFTLRPTPAGPPTGGPDFERAHAARAGTRVKKKLSPTRLVRRGIRYLFGLLILLGAIVTWRSKGSAAHWYCAFTILMLLVVPFPRGRYLFPLLPFMAWFFVAAIEWLVNSAARVSHGAARGLAPAVIIATCLVAIGLTGVGISQRFYLNIRNLGRPWWAPERYETTGADVVNYMKACLWIRDNTSPSAVVVSRKPYHLYLVARRRATWDPLMTPPGQPDKLWDRVLALQRFGPVFVVEDAFGDRFGGAHTKDLLAPVLGRYRRSLQEVALFEGPSTGVYKVVRG